MSNRALALLIAGILCLFVVVWGGLWMVKSQRETAAIAKAVADAKAESDASAAEVVRAAAAAKEKADREYRAKAEAQKKSADENLRAKASDEAEKKAADSKAKRIALFTEAEKLWLDMGRKLATDPKAIHDIVFVPGALPFLVNNRDLLDDPTIIRTRLVERADAIGVDVILNAQRITNPDAVMKAKISFGSMNADQGTLEQIKQTAKDAANGANGLSDQQKVIVRAHPELFPLVLP